MRADSSTDRLHTSLRHGIASLRNGNEVRDNDPTINLERRLKRVYLMFHETNVAGTGIVQDDVFFSPISTVSDGEDFLRWSPSGTV